MHKVNDTLIIKEALFGKERELIKYTNWARCLVETVRTQNKTGQGMGHKYQSYLQLKSNL